MADVIDNIAACSVERPSRLKQDVAEGLPISKGRVSTTDGPGYGITVDPTAFRNG